ncbi:hypothetical protein LIER_10475 [Lithospermum erythrorhizon]|uniref:Uncharacterized protein n=1 Tax=Lithospermum erythrorhizon TaxID=34254 RepID=A0AAV3PLQ2_LITER
MASKEAPSQKGQSSIRGGIVERTLQEGLTSENPSLGNSETKEDTEVFATSMLTEPSGGVTGSSKITSKKHKRTSSEGPKRNSKKVKVLTISEGVRDSQTLEGFRRRTATSVIAKGHLLHLRDHYSIHPKVLMKIPREARLPILPKRDTPRSFGSSSIMTCI